MIKFGTDGWRAIISDEFTFENVKKVARAISIYLQKHKLDKKVLIVGYDARFLADKFALEIIKVMNEAGINCLFPDRDTPTPVIAWEIKQRKASGAIMLTASHNPAQYCGIKFIPEYAGPANLAITKEIEENLKSELSANPSAPLRVRDSSGHRAESRCRGTFDHFNPRPNYFDYLSSFLDIALIKKTKRKIAYDAMFGSGRGYIDAFLESLGHEIIALNCQRDVLFGGRSPEPDEENLHELAKTVKIETCDLGLANDGDADRFGVIDEKGKFISAHRVVVLLANYLMEKKGWRGSLVRSVGTTHMLDKLATKYKVKLHEVPVGFKYIAEIMLKEKVVLGGEESGGLSILNHIPEKDGTLADLLMVEMLNAYNKPLSQIYADLEKELGAFYQGKINLPVKPGVKEKLAQAAKGIKTIGNLKVKELKIIDGVKFLLEDQSSWVLLRPSGTEPLLRGYFESDSLEKLSLIQQDVKAIINKI